MLLLLKLDNAQSINAYLVYGVIDYEFIFVVAGMYLAVLSNVLV